LAKVSGPQADLLTPWYDEESRVLAEVEAVGGWAGFGWSRSESR
jgi:hypothetical protein